MAETYFRTKGDSMKKLVLIGCVHVGMKSANLQWFKDYVGMAKDKDTSLLLLGDLFENAIPSRGEGMVFEQNLTPDEQIDTVAEILSPVKNKIIGCVTSNHSERTYKEVGINMDKRLLRELGLKDSLYKGQQGVVPFAGKLIAFTHGAGSGSNSWGDAKKMLQMYPQADIIALSHKHELTQTWVGNFSLSSNGSRTPKFVPLVRTGSLMEYPRYAQRELYSPQKPGFAVIEFLNDGKLSIDTNGL